MVLCEFEIFKWSLVSYVGRYVFPSTKYTNIEICNNHLSYIFSEVLSSLIFKLTVNMLSTRVYLVHIKIQDHKVV